MLRFILNIQVSYLLLLKIENAAENAYSIYRNYKPHFCRTTYEKLAW